MATLGLNDLKQFALPDGWDGSELLKHSLADNTSMEEVFNDMLVGLSETADSMLSDPFYSTLFSVTEELGAEYRQGSSSGMQERTEYTYADPKRNGTIGHMYPKKGYDRVLGWTRDFLRVARRTQLESDLTAALGDVRDNFEQKLLTRFFSSADNLIAAAGYDVSFVNGGGSVAYVPPPYGGQTFASTHTHFDRKADTGEFDDALEAGAAHLWEHGIRGPYIAIIPSAQRATYTALTKFIKPQRDSINYATSASTGMVNEETFIGQYETDLGLVQLHMNARVPSNYLGMFKGYGANDPRNPLAVRVTPDYKFSPVAIQKTLSLYPLEHLIIQHDFGVGVKDRLNGYACYFASSGSYTDPTIA